MWSITPEEAKRRKITHLKGEETANPALWAAGWKLDFWQGSQVLIPPESEGGEQAGEEAEPSTESGGAEADGQSEVREPETN